jgi:hypothetical protein
MTDKQIALGLDIFRGSDLGQVGVAESALDCDSLDDLPAERAGFAVWVHDSLLPREDINPGEDTNAS